MQLSNLVFALILLPYLTRVLGAETYGIAAFGLAGVAVLSIVTDYGFDYSATRDVAASTGDVDRIRKIVGSVVAVKGIILLIVMTAAAALVLAQAKYEDYRDFFLILLIAVIGTTFQPAWLFHGLQRMTRFAMYTIPAKSLYVVLVLVCVSTSDDYLWVAIAYAVSQCVAAILGWVMVLSSGFIPKWPSGSEIRETFRASSPYFLSRAAVSFYSSGGALYLGIVAAPLDVAYYSACEKIYQGLRAMVTPVTQALFPYMVSTKDTKTFRKLLIVASIAALVFSLAAIAFGQSLLVSIFGDGFSAAYGALIVFSITFLLAVPSLFIGYPFLGAFGKVSEVNSSVVRATGVYAVFLFLVAVLGEASAVYVALAVCVTEAAILALRAIACRKLDLTVFSA